MTVRELRELLYDIEDQDAQIAIPTEYKYGAVSATKAPVRIEEPYEGNTIPKGFVVLVIK